LKPLAGEQTISEWARDVLLKATKLNAGEQTVLAEVLALRTILLNIHFAVSQGRTLTAEEMQQLRRQKATASADRAGFPPLSPAVKGHHRTESLADDRSVERFGGQYSARRSRVSRAAGRPAGWHPKCHLESELFDGHRGDQFAMAVGSCPIYLF